MTTLPLTDVKARLNELIDEAVRTNERVTITRHGRPAAVLISVDDLESLEETIFWSGVPGLSDEIAEGRAEAEAGTVLGEAEIRARYGVGRGR